MFKRLKQNFAFKYFPPRCNSCPNDTRKAYVGIVDPEWVNFQLTLVLRTTPNLTNSAIDDILY